jgi:hypothetical protein
VSAGWLRTDRCYARGAALDGAIGGVRANQSSALGKRHPRLGEERSRCVRAVLRAQSAAGRARRRAEMEERRRVAERRVLAEGLARLVAEGAVGYTKQTDDVNTIEVTPRVGVRLHVFSRELIGVIRARKKPPRHRVVVRDLVRVRVQEPLLHGRRRRFRFIGSLPQPARVPRAAEQGEDDRRRCALPPRRLGMVRPARRAGGALRQQAAHPGRPRVPPSFAWRYEVLYIWTRSRNTFEEEFKTADNSIDIHVKRVF